MVGEGFLCATDNHNVRVIAGHLGVIGAGRLDVVVAAEIVPGPCVATSKKEISRLVTKERFCWAPSNPRLDCHRAGALVTSASQ